MNLIAEPAGMVRTASTSAHLVNLSMATTRRSRERAQDVQPPDRERPRERDGLEALSGLVDLLGMEQTGITGSYQLGGIIKRHGLVESATEYLANEGS